MILGVHRKLIDRRWVTRAVIMVGLTEAPASVILLFFHQVDITALPLITTHLVAVITMTFPIYKSYYIKNTLKALRREGRNVHEMEERSSRVIWTRPKWTLSKWFRGAEWKMPWYVSITIGVFLVSGAVMLDGRI